MPGMDGLAATRAIRALPGPAPRSRHRADRARLAGGRGGLPRAGMDGLRDQADRHGAPARHGRPGRGRRHALGGLSPSQKSPNGDFWAAAPARTPTRPPTTVSWMGGRVGVRAGTGFSRRALSPTARHCRRGTGTAHAGITPPPRPVGPCPALRRCAAAAGRSGRRGSAAAPGSAPSRSPGRRSPPRRAGRWISAPGPSANRKGTRPKAAMEAVSVTGVMRRRAPSITASRSASPCSTISRLM